MKKYNLNCSSEKLKEKLDSLKIENPNEANDTDICCKRKGNKFKLLFAQKDPCIELNILGIKGYTPRIEGILTEAFFKGEIIEENDKCIIKGRCKASVAFTTFLVMIIIFILSVEAMCFLIDGIVYNGIWIFLFIPLTALLLIRYRCGRIFDRYIKEMIEKLEE